MARSLYSKFILGYLIFGLLSILTIATFSSGITRDYLVKDLPAHRNMGSQ